MTLVLPSHDRNASQEHRHSVQSPLKIPLLRLRTRPQITKQPPNWSNLQSHSPLRRKGGTDVLSHNLGLRALTTSTQVSSPSRRQSLHRRLSILPSKANSRLQRIWM